MQGLVVIDKPEGFTSFDVVAKVRKITGIKRIGHTGTLDPMATGVLPVLIGRATKLSDLMPETDKGYLGRIQLGLQTDTLDITGRVVRESKSHITREELEDTLSRFRGEISQTPPMYSAVSVNGVRLYRLARQGKVVDRPSRKVKIHKLEMAAFDEIAQQCEIKVLCSKGAYIRALVQDIGESLGCGAALQALRRTVACGFTLSDAVTLSALEEKGPEAFLIPPDRLYAGFGEVLVSEAQAQRFANGGALSLDRTGLVGKAGLYRVYDPDRAFLGLGQADNEAGVLKIKCLMVGG